MFIAVFPQPRALRILRKCIVSLLNSPEEVNNLLDYSPVNNSLHNLPVNRIFMNMSFS
jgi:hypothetical protein